MLTRLTKDYLESKSKAENARKIFDSLSKRIAETESSSRTVQFIMKELYTKRTLLAQHKDKINQQVKEKIKDKQQIHSNNLETIEQQKAQIQGKIKEYQTAQKRIEEYKNQLQLKEQEAQESTQEKLKWDKEETEKNIQVQEKMELLFKNFKTNDQDELISRYLFNLYQINSMEQQKDAYLMDMYKKTKQINDLLHERDIQKLRYEQQFEILRARMHDQFESMNLFPQ